MYSGLLDLSWPWLIVVTLVMTHLTIASVTLYLHRHQSHRALDLHPAVAHLFRFWLWLTTGMVTREWVAIHRKHHAFVETADDPHSPQVKGIRQVFWQGAELYRAAALEPETLERYGKGTPDDWLERHLYGRRSWLGVTLMLAVDAALFGVIGLTVWAVQMIWIPLFAAGVINGIGHWAGYRNHACPDASRNIVPWGILIGGEELHNNHHAHANSARLSHRRWEFDIGWFYVRALAALGLARVRHVAPRPVVALPRERIDLAAARAIVGTRFRVMHDYGRRVIRPVLKEELKLGAGGGRRLIRQARRLLVQGGSGDERVERALSVSERLRTVHEFRQALSGIWQGERRNADALLRALQEWCVRAERSGIDALARFARSLRGYGLVTA